MIYYKAREERDQRENTIMSLLGKLFGGKKKDEGEDPQNAIQRLRETEEMLNKKSDFLEKKIDEELKAAKTHGTKNKRAALQVGEAALWGEGHSFVRSFVRSFTSSCVSLFDW